MEKRLTCIGVLLVFGFTVLLANLAVHMKNSSYTQAALRQSRMTVTVGTAEGTIYDRNFVPFVNRETTLYAVVNPTPSAIRELVPQLEEVTSIAGYIHAGEPFACRVRTADLSDPDITVLEVPVRCSGPLTAQHVLGYTLEGTGITGLEADCDSILRSIRDAASVTYTVDAGGNVLPGAEKIVTPVRNANPGVVTTLDARIQRICEEAGDSLGKGAVIVMDTATGDVLAMASFPAYDPDALGEALSDPDSPLINRCLYAYNVGSIFKLMTCAAAYRQGLTDFRMQCSGTTQVSSQLFRCHDLNGHGMVDMRRAMVYSCNTYFIQLSTLLDPALFRETAQDFGFGTQIVLSHSIAASGGTLPTLRDLTHPAELANFSFGQGLLTASPLQVAQMTCGIANGGRMPHARLIRGYTADGRTVEQEQEPVLAAAADAQTAAFLQGLMQAAVSENESSNAAPSNTTAAAKTSTAQTGRFAPDGTEYCHGWITGFFPAEAPQYAVTVLAEDGGYGNDAAAPVFREIAERITELT